MRFIDERGDSRLAQLHAATRRPEGPSAAIVESWNRAAASRVDLATIETTFVGNADADTTFESCAVRLGETTAGRSSILVSDSQAVIRVRRDGDESFARLLDSLSLSPGYQLGDKVGNSATSLALSTLEDVELDGAEHYHPQLTSIAEASAVVRDRDTRETRGVVTVVADAGQATSLLLAHARLLADKLSDLLADEPGRRTRAVFERFDERSTHRQEWIVATDGHSVFTGSTAAALEPMDLRALTDSALGALTLQEFTTFEAALPSGVLADLELESILLDGEVVGSLLIAAPCRVDDNRQTEAVRRQGAHVTSSMRRDYATDLREPATHHAIDGPRDTKDLMTPYVRARHDIAASIRAHRNHVVIGEAGVGKQSLVIAEFRAAHPDGRVLTADCSDFTGDVLPVRSASGGLFHGSLDDGPHLLIIGSLDALPPVGARRLDDILRPLHSGAARPLLVGSINETTIDVSRPYGLVMRYFFETIRVPPLRLRIDDIGDLALEILGKIAGGRSLRLSYQAIRVLEGYSWPGNVSELEDVLRYVIARKPVGEVQARDLPAVCFQGSSRRLSMLESAQRDAIIQALYESKGNRYKAAAALGIARSSLYRKIDSFGISYIA